jgi:DNA-binding XRE family transcriptional regulator
MPQKEPMTTAARYKSTREHLGTQAEVARRLGVSRVTLARRETGKLPINREAWLAIESLKRCK